MPCKPVRARLATRASRLAVAWLVAVTPVLATITALTAVTTIAGVASAPAAGAVTHPTGIDVSNYQHPNGAPIDWSAVRNSGISFAFIKATEGPVSCSGSLYTNPYFLSDWKAAASVGLYRGAYHFARPGDLTSAITQAHQFAAVVGSLNGTMDLPPVLDLEVTCGLSAGDISAWAHAWIDEVARLTGRHAVITTYPSFWSDAMGGDTSFSTVPLWIATYGPSPIVPPAWTYWTFWQSSSTATVPGISSLVDFDTFCCGDAGLARLAADQEHDPFGVVEETMPGYGTVRVSGWTLDLDSFDPTTVHVYVDGVGTVITANLPRADIKAEWPAWGQYHGFTTTIGPLTGGNHQVCVYAITIGPGNNVLMLCRTVSVPSPDPRGSVDAVTPTGLRTVSVAGWAMDPETSSSDQVIASIDGQVAATTLASGPRPDVDQVFKNGPYHGFGFNLTLPSGGPHQLCFTATEIAGYGADASIGCRSVNLPTGSPFGVLDDVHAEPGLVRVVGWTLDPDTVNAIPTHVYVDGVGRAFTADAARPDLAAAFPWYGPAHGIALTYTGLSPGAHNVCVYGIEQAGTGANTLLGCRSVTVPGGSPRGAIDAITTGPGKIRVQGWTLDPDTAAPTLTHIYVDGVGQAFSADAPRPDIAAAFVGYGPNHGIDATISGLLPGSHTVCVYGIETVGGGPNVLLGCRIASLPTGSPFGYVDNITGAPGSLHVAGWTIDPDVVSPIAVHVYVDGVGRAFTASALRPDVGAAYPDYGSAHGMDISFTGLAAGKHTVCTYAIDAAGSGSNTLLDCRFVTTT